MSWETVAYRSTGYYEPLWSFPIWKPVAGTAPNLGAAGPPRSRASPKTGTAQQGSGISRTTETPRSRTRRWTRTSTRTTSNSSSPTSPARPCWSPRSGPQGPSTVRRGCPRGARWSGAGRDREVHGDSELIADVPVATFAGTPTVALGPSEAVVLMAPPENNPSGVRGPGRRAAGARGTTHVGPRRSTRRPGCPRG